MTRTIILVALTGFLGGALPALAHHHHQIERKLSHTGAASEVVFLAELTEEPGTPPTRTAGPADTRGPERSAAQAALPAQRVAVPIGEGFHDGETTIPALFLAGLGAETPNLITSRVPRELPVFNETLAASLANASR